MTQDEIIEITKQAGGFSPTPEFLEAFAKLVAAAAASKEREACAKICEELDSASYPYVVVFPDKCAAAIRQRGKYE